MSNTSYSYLGVYPSLTAAQLADIDEAINVVGDTRKGGDSSGKRAGMLVAVDLGSSQYGLAMALGSAANSKWQLIGVAATQYTPS